MLGSFLATLHPLRGAASEGWTWRDASPRLLNAIEAHSQLRHTGLAHFRRLEALPRTSALSPSYLSTR